MKMLMFGAAMALGTLGVSTTDVRAERMVNVDGVEYPLSKLTENCQSMSNDPQAMIDCFNALAAHIEGKPAETQVDTASVGQALETLRNVAQFQNNDTGLSIAGSDCTIEVVYFGNYFHVSRRNVSTLDLFVATFDAASVQYDQISSVSGAQVALSRVAMGAGASATVRGGVALESAQLNFPAKSARLSMADYAREVAAHLPANNAQTFDFVLVHPARQQASADIWNAFKEFVTACQGSTSTPSWLPKTN